MCIKIKNGVFDLKMCAFSEPIISKIFLMTNRAALGDLLLILLPLCQRALHLWLLCITIVEAFQID